MLIDVTLIVLVGGEPKVSEARKKHSFEQGARSGWDSWDASSPDKARCKNNGVKCISVCYLLPLSLLLLLLFITHLPPKVGSNGLGLLRALLTAAGSLLSSILYLPLICCLVLPGNSVLIISKSVPHILSAS